MEQLDTVTKPTVAHECIKSILYYKRSVPATRFGQSCGHLQGGALQRTDIYGDIAKVCEPMYIRQIPSCLVSVYPTCNPRSVLLGTY